MEKKNLIFPVKSTEFYESHWTFQRATPVELSHRSSWWQRAGKSGNHGLLGARTDWVKACVVV